MPHQMGLTLVPSSLPVDSVLAWDTTTVLPASRLTLKTLSSGSCWHCPFIFLLDSEIQCWTLGS